MSNPYYLTAFIDEEGQRRPFSFKIEGPFATTESKNFYCRVVSPELLDKEFNIYGDSGGQTKELALKLVEICLRGKKIYDEAGNDLVLEAWK
jgi:hypothetical protein